MFYNKARNRNFIFKGLILFLCIGISSLIRAQYAGTYSVGGISPDFKSLDSAFFYLAKKGITSSVRLQVRSGTYIGQTIIDSIKGINSNNTIKIVPDPKNTKPVRFKHKINSLTNNYIFKIKQGYWQFDSVQFIVDSTSFFGRIFEFTANCENIGFNYCKFYGRDTFSQCNSYFTILQDLSNVKINHFKILNCTFYNGSTALIHLASATDYETGLELINNAFVGYNCFALWLSYNTSPFIKGNTFENHKRDGSYKTMQISNCDSFVFIENSVNHNVANSTYGIHIQDCNGSSKKPNIIANNAMVILDSVSSNSGPCIYLEGGRYHSIFYNTLVNYAHSPNSKCIYLDQKSSGQNSRFMNNNLINLGSGYAFFVSGIAGFSEMDNNNYYTNGNVLGYLNGTNLATINDIKQTTKMESNSINAKVDFKTILDLHSNTFELDSAAKPLSGYSNDKDGNKRDSKKPDIGAYEFSLPSNNLGFIKIITPPGNICGYDSVAIQVIIKNYGRLEAKNFKVELIAKDAKNIVLKDTIFYSKTLKSQAKDTITFAKFWTNQGGYFKVICKIDYRSDSINDNDTMSKNLLLIKGITPPETNSDTFCSNESVNLSTKFSSETYLKWYTAQIGGKLIAKANQITVSNLKSDTSFYMSSVQLTPYSDKFSTPKVPQTSCNAGIMFDIIPKRTLKLDSFASSFSYYGNEIIYVYMRRSSYSGNETNQKGWVCIDTITVNVPTSTSYANIPLKRSIKLNKDSAYGFYLYFPKVKYAVTSNTVYSSSDLAIKTGSGLCGFFSTVLTDRAFVGDVFYSKYIECESPRVPFRVKIKQAPKLNLGKDTAYCSINGLLISLDAGSDAIKFNWSTRDTSRFLKVNKEGTYSVLVEDNQGCFNSDSIKIIKNITPIINIGSDTGFCNYNGIDLTLNAGVGYTSYLWEPYGTSQTFKVIEKGKYKVTVLDKNLCSTIDSISVYEFPIQKPKLGKDTIYCMNESVPFELIAGKQFKSYFWSNKVTSGSIFINKGGNYWVNVIDSNGCKNGDTIFVLISNKPRVQLGSDTSYCIKKGAFVTLDAGKGYTTYIWSNLETVPKIKVYQTGLYNVDVFNSDNCIGQDSIFLTLNQNPSVKLGNDTTFCSDQGIKLNLDAGSNFSKYKWSDGSFNQKYTVLKEGIYDVAVTDSMNCQARDTLIIRKKQSPSVSLGSDKILPNGSLIDITLDAGNGFTQYLWNTKENTQKINVKKEGIYFVEVKDTSGCFGSDTVKINYKTNVINNLSPNNEITISPNPCSDKLQIWIKKGKIEKFIVYNFQGQQILQKEIDDNTFQLNTKEWVNGIFSLIIWIDSIPYFTKFIVIH